jgi:hypothetical protein
MKVIIMAAALLLAACGITRAAAAAELSVDDARVIVRAALDDVFIDIPIGELIVSRNADLLTKHRSLCGHNPLLIGGIMRLVSAEKAGLITVEGEPSLPRGSRAMWLKLMYEMAMAHVDRRITVTPTARARAVDLSAGLPARQQIPNCIRYKKGKFVVNSVSVSVVHGQGGNLAPDRRTIDASYSVAVSADIPQMPESFTYPNEGRIEILMQYDPKSAQWNQSHSYLRSRHHR